MPTGEELEHYYRIQSSNDRWKYEDDRPVWKSIKRRLASSPKRSILDVGCFKGDLLDYLGPSWDRFGVELSPEASRKARERGIEIMGATVEDLPLSVGRFGAVTLVDVIEHLRRPFDCLQRLAELLLPGGKLIVFTGSTDALSWRLTGVRYWYSALPEHVAFFRPSWFRWAANRLGCTLMKVERMSHRPACLSVRIDEALKNILFATYHRLNSVPTLAPLLGLLPGLRAASRWHTCWWTTASDHILVTLTKRS